jgi:hypothetical protein
MPASPRLTRFLLGVALLLGGSLLFGQTGWTPSTDFLQRMSDDERLATGVHELSEQEKANLENLVAYEVASARAGNVTGFAGTFSSRRSEDQLKATGIDRLSEEQRERLDQHVAGYLADTPRVPYISRHERVSGSAARTEADEAMQGQGPVLRVNGEVSITVGGSSAGSYYGGSATTVISNQSGSFRAAVRVDTMKGNVPYYDYYDYRYPRSRLQRSTLRP